MATSTVPAYKAALKTALVARTGLANVQVTHGPPFPLPETEFIWLADAKGAQDWATYGASGLRREEYDLTVWIRVLRSTTPDDFKTAGDRAFALQAEIENSLRADPTVGAVVDSSLVTGFDFREDATPEQNVAQIELTVHVNAFV